MALVNSINMVLVTQARLDIATIASLLSCVYKELCSTKDFLTPLVVDTLISWVTPSLDKWRELVQARGAKQTIQQAISVLCRSSVASYRLVFRQGRAGLVGRGMGAETRFIPGVKEYGRFAVNKVDEEENLQTIQNCVAQA